VYLLCYRRPPIDGLSFVLLQRFVHAPPETTAFFAGSEAMTVTPIKALLFLASFCSAVALESYGLHVTKSDIGDAPATLPSLTQPGSSGDPKTASLFDPRSVASTSSLPNFAAIPEILPPSFDVVRVDDDGSLVIAGKGAPNATIEIVAGKGVIGSTVAGRDGDFAIVLDEPLTPGAYQLVLRSITPENVIATSLETAVVSIPQPKGRERLVLVDQSGEPSKTSSAPEKESGKPASPANLPTADVAPAQAQLPSAASNRSSRVAVEAVEIEGRKVFLAGVADPGRSVRGYVNDKLLGEARTSADGRFLIEAERDIAVGDHTIRLDLIEPDGVKVAARAAVPFERDPGGTFAAVATTAPTTVDNGASASVGSEPVTGTDVAAGSEKLAPKLKNVHSAVIIRQGDTLWRISHRVYGHGMRYPTIYFANARQISDPDRIWPGQVFKVPEKTTEGEPANMKAIGEQATALQ
jgi:nucleoid-associated protein YgaU